MPRPAKALLQQPLFHEPAFSETDQTPDPTGFKTPHPSDSALYKQLGNLLKKEVVSFSHKRGAPGDLLALADAYGAHGPQIVQLIQTAGRIVFHAGGDSGASNAGLYPDEVKVADRLTADCQTSPANDRPAFLFHLGDIVYNFGEILLRPILRTLPQLSGAHFRRSGES